MNAVIFKNFTDEEFVGKWDGTEYRFAPGQEMYMEDWKAKHFAKHLIDRELNKRNLPTNSNSERDALERQAVLESSEEVSETEILDKNTRKARTKKVAEPKEEEFADLNDEEQVEEKPKKRSKTK